MILGFSVLYDGHEGQNTLVAKIPRKLK